MFLCTLSIWLRTQLPRYTITAVYNLVKKTTTSVCNHLSTKSGQDYNCLSAQPPWYTIWSRTQLPRYTFTAVHNHLGTLSGLKLFHLGNFLSWIFFFFFNFILFYFTFVCLNFFIRVWPLLTSALPVGKTQKVAKIEVLEPFFAATSSNIQKIVKNSLKVGLFNKK